MRFLSDPPRFYLRFRPLTHFSFDDLAFHVIALHF